MTSLLSLLDSYLRSHELTEPERMLKEFLSAPEQFQSTWRPIIVAKLCDEGRRQAAQGSLALAIDAYNQALALDRQCEAAKSGLSSLTSRSRRRRRAKMVGVAALGVAAALALGALVFAPQPPPERREASAVNAPLLMEGPTGLAAVNQPGDVGGGATARASAQVQPSADVSQAMAASSDAVAGGADVRVEIAASGDAGTLQRRAPKTRDKRRRGGGARLTNANRSKRRPTAVGGAKEVEAPRPLPTLPVRLGSTPPNAEISLDGKFITSDGSAKRHLVVGQQYVMACKPSEQLLERCPSCENKMTVRFRVPKRAPPGGIVSQKCDFRRCCPKSAFGLPK